MNSRFDNLNLKLTLDYKKWCEKTDIWSLGCMLFELYKGGLCFPTHESYHHLALIEKRLSTKIPKEMAKRALNMEWFNKVGLEMIYFKTRFGNIIFAE